MLKFKMLSFLALAAISVAGAQAQIPARKTVAALKKQNVVRRESDAGAFTAPFTLAPTQEEFGLCVVEDVNADGVTWKLLGAGSVTALNYGYSLSQAADDWFFIPVSGVDAGAQCTMKFKMKSSLAESTEKVAVAVGGRASSTAMTRVREWTVKNTSYSEYEVSFEAPSGGVFFVGIHAESPAGQSGISIRNIAFEAASNAEGRQLPFFIAPTAAEFEADCTVVDANGDGNSWEYDASENAMRYYMSSTYDADDWVFLPAIDFGTGGAFDFSMDARAADRSCPESFEVCVGNAPTPQAMRSQAVFSDININVFLPYEGVLNVPEGGVAYVGIHATSPRDRWSLYVRNISVSRSEVKTPAAATLTATAEGTVATLTVTLPSTAADGSALSEPVGATVAVDGVQVRRIEPSTGKQHTLTLDLTVGKHTISATPFIVIGGNEVAGPATSVDITISRPDGYVYPLPMSIQPTRGEFDAMTSLDADSDGVCWDYNDNDGSARVRHGESGGGDDWLFFPPFAVTDASRLLDISIDARAYMERYPESVELYIGRTPEVSAMTRIASDSGLNTYIYKTISAEYTPAEIGSYVVAVRCNTASGGHTLNVKNLSVKESNLTTAAPAPVDDIVAVPDAAGGLSATVTMTLPSKSISGSALPASDMLTATVISPAGTASVSGRPGERVSCTVATRDGYNELTIEVQSAAYGKGRSASATVRCGLDTPSAPALSAAVDESNLSMTVTWTDSSVGQNGGAVGEAPLAHNIYIADETGTFWQELDAVAAGENSYTYTVRADVAQQSVLLGVAAVSAKGESEIAAVAEVLGTPYPMPLVDSFTNGGYLFEPVVTLCPDDNCANTWGITFPHEFFPEIDSKTSALYCLNQAGSGKTYALLQLPKVSTADSERGVVELSLFTSPLSPAVKVLGSSRDNRDVLIGEIPAGGERGWRNFSFAIPESLLGKKWVALTLRPEFGSADCLLLVGGYAVKNVYEREVALSMAAPAECVVGQTAAIRVGIEQIGLQTVQVPEPEMLLTFSDNTTLSLAPTKSGEEYLFSYTPVAEHLGSVKMQASLPGFTDDNPANNTAERTIEVTDGGQPIVTDLKGRLLDDGKLRLSWSIPEFSDVITEDFEKYDSFTYAENIGPWTNLDLDGRDVCGIGFPIPGATVPKAFQIFDAAALDVDTSIVPYSGSKCLMVVTPADASYADDWFISPEIRGGSDLSFMFSILAEEYGAERIDLMYSAGDDPLRISDYKLIQTYSKGLREWSKIECTLPDDARYFAFHYRTDDVFGLLLDDICYSPANLSAPEGFRLTRSSSSEAATLPYTTDFADIDAPVDMEQFNLYVTHDGGKLYPASNTFTYSISGVDEGIADAAAVVGERGSIRISGLDGHRIAVSNAAGQLLTDLRATAEMRIPMAPGIYMVSSGSRNWKVIVR